MDVDLDIDMVDTADVDIIAGTEPLEMDIDLAVSSENAQDNKSSLATSTEATTPVFSKLHITGLDSLSTADVKAFVAEHVSGARVDRVEWVNDTGANVIFSCDTDAHDALIALSAVDIQNASAMAPGESVDAKSYSGKRDVHLRVRFALQSDKKLPGAYKRSKFYLYHPELDPESRLLESKYRDRRDGSSRSRGRASRNHRRHESAHDEFDVSFYDDNNEADLSHRSNLQSRDYRQESDGKRPRRQRYTKSTSRSPSRDYRNRNDKIDVPSGKHTTRYRNRSKGSRPEPDPGRVSRNRDRSRSPTRNNDLYHDHHASTSPRQPRQKKPGRRLEDRITRLDTGPKELFPEKLGLGGSQLDRVDQAFVSASLHPTLTLESNHLSIRGLSKRQTTTGIQIKGRAKTAKELFPDRFGDGAKPDLLNGKMQQRGHPRRKAVDSFS